MCDAIVRAVALFSLFAGIVSSGFGQTVYSPADSTEFAAAAAVVNPGDTIILPAGTVTDWGPLAISRDGTLEAPITVRAPSVFGTLIRGTTSFRLSGDHIVMKGMRFVNTTADYPVWFDGASHGKVTQCYFEGANASSYVRADPAAGVLDSASYLRIEHNYFTVGAPNAINLVGLDDPNFVGQHIIEHNLFRDAPPGSVSREALSLYAAGLHKGNRMNSTVSYNVFDNWDADSDGEIVTVKSGGNTLFRNVFAWCEGYLSLRRENENLVDGNLFYQNRYGLRVFGDGHTVINNVFESNARWALAISNGWLRESDGVEAKAATNCLVAHNTFLGTPYRSWYFPTSSIHADGIGVLPTGNTLLNNIVESTVNTNELVRDQSGFVPANTVSHNLFHQVGGSLGPTGTSPVLGGSALLTGSGDRMYLLSGSPALGTGISSSGVGDDFFGSSRNATPDLGHHEYSAAASPLADPPLPPLPPDRTGYGALPLEAAFSTYPTVVVAGEAMNLDAASSKGDIVSYTWDFGDENAYIGTEMFVPYDWNTPGVYTVTLTVEDGSANIDSIQLQVVVTNPDNPYDPFIDADGDWVHAANDPDDYDPGTPFTDPLRSECVRQGNDWILRVPLSPGVTTTAQQSDDLSGWTSFHVFGQVVVPKIGETTIPAPLGPPAKTFSSWRVQKVRP